METVNRPHAFSFTEARTGLKSILDSSTRGGIADISSGHRRAAVVDSGRLREYLLATVSFPVTAQREDNSYVLVSEGQPFAAEAATINEAIDLLVDDLLDYTEEWPSLYADASNHSQNWGLVQLVALSSRDELREFVIDAAA